MTSQSRCSRDDSFLATGTGLGVRGDRGEAVLVAEINFHLRNEVHR